MAESVPPDERPVLTIYPSIAALAPGRALGILYESLPLRIGGIKLSHLLFPLPTSPVALVLYFWMKAVGPRYLLTTNRLRIIHGLKGTAGAEVPLDEVGRVEVVTTFGQRFFHAGTLIVRDHMGTERLRCLGVVRPEICRLTILETRDALISTDAALRTIESRHTAGVGAA